jgi:ribonuclease-3
MEGKLLQKIKELEEHLKYCFRNKSLLLRALTHISYSKSHGVPYNYERLEFLGDSVVNYLLVDLLYEKFGKLPLGKLATIKAFLISEHFLARLADKWEIEKFILLSKDEELKGQRESISVKADVFEAVVAAVYLDCGKSIDFVKRWFRFHFEKETVEAVKGGDFYRDFKTLLQEITQSEFKEKPTYTLIKEEGPPHSKTFTVECSVKDLKTIGEGKTKKEAEQEAAKKMVKEHFKDKLDKLTRF